MSVQNHIHLSDTLGGAPENAPAKTYMAHQRDDQPTIFIAIERSLSGGLMGHVLQSGGAPVLKDNFEYILRVDQTELDELRALLGKQVYFVDHIHPNDGQDHTAYVKQGILSVLSNIRNIDPMLHRYHCRIRFEEN